MRERKKPKESWLQRAKYEIENADYLLALRKLELKFIRKEKEKNNLQVSNYFRNFAKEIERYGREKTNRRRPLLEMRYNADYIYKGKQP